jgi:hypothetical protein
MQYEVMQPLNFLCQQVITSSADAKSLTLYISEFKALDQALFDFSTSDNLEQWLRSQMQIVSTEETRS